MTTTRDTPRTVQHAGSSDLSGYGFLVTNAEEFTAKAKAAQRRQVEAEARVADAIADRNAAIVGMNDEGMSPGAIAKELAVDGYKMSPTNVRLIIKVHRGPRAKDGSNA